MDAHAATSMATRRIRAYQTQVRQPNQRTHAFQLMSLSRSLFLLVPQQVGATMVTIGPPHPTPFFFIQKNKLINHSHES